MIVAGGTVPMYSASPLVRGAGVGFAVDPVASQVGVAPYPYAAVGLTQAAGFPPSAAAYAPGLVGVNPYAAVNPYTGVNPYAIAASPYAAPGVVGLAPSAAVGVDGRLYASPVQTASDSMYGSMYGGAMRPWAPLGQMSPMGYGYGMGPQTMVPAAIGPVVSGLVPAAASMAAVDGRLYASPNALGVSTIGLAPNAASIGVDGRLYASPTFVGAGGFRGLGTVF